MEVMASEDVFFDEQFNTFRLNSDGSTDPSFMEQAGFASGLDSDDRIFLATNDEVGFRRMNPNGTLDSSLDAGTVYSNLPSNRWENPNPWKFLVRSWRAAISGLLV